jgi:acyl carrier protein
MVKRDTGAARAAYGMITTKDLRKELTKIDWDIDVRALRDDQPFIEQGLDSLDMISLLFCLEEVFSVKIPDKDVDSLKTLSDCARYLNREL